METLRTMPYRYLLIIALTIFWLLLSGYWTNPIILTLGAASVALSTWIAMRIEKKYAFKDKGGRNYHATTYLLALANS